jgi:hypothetical protein
MIKRSFFGGLGGASFEEDFKGSGEGWLLIRKKKHEGHYERLEKTIWQSQCGDEMFYVV